MSKGRGAITTEGVVLRLASHGENNRVVTLLSPDYGKISCFARGARGSKKRYGGALDLFLSLDLTVVQGEGLWSLRSSKITAHRVPIRNSLKALQRASLLSEVVSALTAEEIPSPATYVALSWALDKLCDKTTLPRAVTAYPRILMEAGLLGALDICLSCGQALQNFGRLDGARGGIVCANCMGGARLKAAPKPFIGCYAEQPMHLTAPLGQAPPPRHAASAALARTPQSDPQSPSTPLKDPTPSPSSTAPSIVSNFSSNNTSIQSEPSVLSVLRGGPCRDPLIADEVESVLCDYVEYHTGKALRAKQAALW